MFNYPTQLICAGLKEPDADATWTRSFPHFDLSELTWAVVRHRLEQGGWVLECTGRGIELIAEKKQYGEAVRCELWRVVGEGAGQYCGSAEEES